MNNMNKAGLIILLGMIYFNTFLLLTPLIERNPMLFVLGELGLLASGLTLLSMKQ